ncbi:MAG: flagellar assembly protein FliW [Tepidanaerobacteraceae bacterium]|jgi:flagellar assembly factor FliW|nr:flagellar assembly protein FliW [Thermoanaerobacterales bacterium]
MLINTRFGSVEVKEEKIITFLNGILGLEKYKKYILLDHPGTDTVKWLQSIKDPAIALPVTNPSYFYTDYAPKVSRENIEPLKIKSAEDTIILCVMTIPTNPTEISVNLKAPIIINTALRIADQFIAENDEYTVREPLNLKKASTNRRCESC